MRKDREPKAKIRPKMDIEIACDGDDHTNWTKDDKKKQPSVREKITIREAIVIGTTEEMDELDSFLDINLN